MVSWTGKNYKYDFDLWSFAQHSMYYFTAVVVASYAAHLLWRLHKYIVAKYGGKAVEKQEEETEQQKPKQN